MLASHLENADDKRTIENVVISIETPQVGDISIEQEIKCPRCHDVMTLRSEFDSIGYLCGECDFSLQGIEVRVLNLFLRHILSPQEFVRNAHIYYFMLYRVTSQFHNPYSI